MLHTPAPAALACLDAVALASGELVRLIGATSTLSTITLGQRMSSDSEKAASLSKADRLAAKQS